MASETDVFASPDEKTAQLERYFERLSAPQHLRFATRAEWERRRRLVRREVLRSLGLDPLPERVPLAPVYGGSLDRDGYTLRRVYFNTAPRMVASGWLYLPKAPGRHPAILNPHGHWENGAMHPVVQSRCIGLARLGYVALAVDSVHQGADAYLAGVSSLTAMMWNNIRALDLLETLPEVDASRIGCTGASGGGQQTMYLMAIDDRVKAAVPAVLVSYFRKILFPGENTHCICNFVPGLLKVTDEPEIAATFAPRPVLYLCVTGDWTAEFPREEYPEIRGVYGLYGAEERICCEQWESGHDYSLPMRERMYAWFNRWLKGNEDPQAAREPGVRPEALETLKALDAPPAGVRAQSELPQDFEARFGFTPPRPQDAREWRAYAGNLRKRLGGLLRDVPVQGELAGPVQPAAIAGWAAEKWRVRSEPEIEVPALFLKPPGGERPPAVVLLHPEGKRETVRQHAEMVGALLNGGAAVLLPDVRLTGELAHAWDLNTILWGRPEVGMALTDVRACLDVLAARADCDGRRVGLIGLGEAGAMALFIGALEPRLCAVAADAAGATYGERRNRPLVANIRRVADLPQVAAAIAPRALFLGGAGPAWAFTSDAYTGMRAGERVRLRVAALPAAALADQLLTALRDGTPGR